MLLLFGFTLPAAVHASSDWSVTYLGLGWGALSGNGYDSRSTIILKYTVFDYQRDKYSMMLSVSGTPRSDSEYKDVKLLFFGGCKYIQIGTGIAGGGLDATPRKTSFTDGDIIPLISLNPNRKLGVYAIGIPAAVRVTLIKTKNTFLRLTGYRTLYGKGYARIPVITPLANDGYVETNKGKGRYEGIEADLWRLVSKHVFIGITAFWTRGRAYGMEYKDTFFGLLKGRAPDTDFTRWGGFLEVGYKF